jgi:hypothetical protein
MDSGVPLAPSFTATPPMMFPLISWGQILLFFIMVCRTMALSQCLGSLVILMVDMSSHLPSSVSPPYENTSFGSGGMMPPYSPSPFGGSHILQTPLTVGGWNLPSYESTMREVSAQIGNHSTYYTPSTYPSSLCSVPMNTFPMEDLHLSSGVSSRGSYFYSMGNPLHEVPSCLGETYILT